jgi:heptosyltransferase-2/heptosyltransferase-3
MVWRRVLLKALALPSRLGRDAAPTGRDARPASGAPAALRGWRRAVAGDAQDGRGLRILVIRPDHLGDLLLTTPALGLLRAGLPDATITALVGPWARPALAGRPEVDEVRTCAFPGFTREPPGGPLAPYGRLLAEARRLRRARYDAALVLRVDHWWGAALAAYAGIPLRLGYGVPESRDFLTHALPPDFAQHSVAENWRVVAALLALLGRPLPAARPGPVVAAPSPAGQAAAARWLAERGVAPGARLVAIHPGTGAAVKLWPAAGWSAVADALARRLDARSVVTGSAAERPLVAAVLAGTEAEAIGAAGALDWDGLAGLFARCVLVLGVDSGPLHLAAALGVPTVHVFGPTAPARFGPWGRGAHQVVRAPLPCSPCGNLLAPPCGARAEPACLRAVRPAAVIDAALAAVAGTTDALPPNDLPDTPSPNGLLVAPAAAGLSPAPPPSPPRRRPR